MPRRTTAQRGYDYAHQQLRRAWEPRVAAGSVRCARCRRPIRPGSDWDLGHDDNDRSKYRGPEHQRCNRAAGAAKGNRSPLRKRRAVQRVAQAVTSLRW